MNRRTFLKSVGKTIGGVLGIGIVSLPKAKATKKSESRTIEPIDGIGYWRHQPISEQGHSFDWRCFMAGAV